MASRKWVWLTPLPKRKNVLRQLNPGQSLNRLAARLFDGRPGLWFCGVLSVMAIALLGFVSFQGAAMPLPVNIALCALALLLAVLSTYGLSRQEFEAPAAASQSDYAILAANMADVLVRHARCGSVQFVSAAIGRAFGLHEADLLGNGLFERVHVADRPAYLHALSEAMASGRDVTVDFRLRRSHEAGFAWVQMRCRPLISENGTEIVSTLADISARKEQEDLLASAREEVDRAQQAKGRFLANVSHELRTPLNAILGFSDMLMHENTLRLTAERRHEYAGLIHTSGTHLLNLVNSILDMSKLESGHFQITPEPFDLAPVVESVVGMLALDASANGSRIEVDLPASLPELNADKRACRQILINLLSNAVKFTPKDGVIIVGARNEGHHIALFVADTGAGIAEDDVSKLGTPFFQARSTYDKQHQGTGLGLSVVRGLAELHGGRMDVVSRLGEGTRVSVHLPSAGTVVTPIRAAADKRDDDIRRIAGMVQKSA